MTAPFASHPTRSSSCATARKRSSRRSRPCLQCSAPIKVFGDIHGQYQDLMRLFAQFGSPSREADGGDIQVCDYLFLGDYVDRGKHSLEVVCLLLALKLSFPNRIFLVRGNHESPEVNARDGFLHECVQRFGGRAEGIAAWRRVNLVFEWLPMAALINNAILGVHGGIGRGVESPSQIAAMRRPLRMGGENGALLLDLLWSDPTASDAVEGVHTNHERGHPVVCYGPDRVKSFLEANNLSLILRAHECVMDGFQRFAGGRLITVFSATNYCNRWANAGAILLVGKDLEIVPKMIYPLDDLEDAWIDAPHPERSPANDTPPPEDLREMRPPTPPRDAPEALREKKAEKEEEDDDDDAKPPPQRMGMGPPQLKRKASLMSSLVRKSSRRTMTRMRKTAMARRTSATAARARRAAAAPGSIGQRRSGVSHSEDTVPFGVCTNKIGDTSLSERTTQPSGAS